MSLKTLIFIGLIVICSKKIMSQDYFSYGSSNFSGLSQVFSNPAAAADNRLKLDVVVGGGDITFNNSWFAIKRDALKNTGSLSHPSFPLSWKNSTPNVPNNVFKNFSILSMASARAAILGNRMLLPSAMYQIDEKNAIAFTWSVRQLTNIDGISPQLAHLFEKELDLSVTQNNRFQTGNIHMVQMTWAEYGLTYARVLKDKREHFLKAGITPKLLQGFESAYLNVRDLDFYLSTKDTTSYFNMNFSFAHSSNFHAVPAYRYVSRPGLGLDLGIIYEWRPDHQSFRYKTDEKHSSWRKDLNKYKLKLSAAIVDIGKIKFDKQGSYYDLNVAVRKDNVTPFLTSQNFAQFDSLVRSKFSLQDQSSSYSVLLPTAFNTQLDYSINRSFYLNLSAHIGNLFRSNALRVYNYSAVCFAPRFECYWLDVSVPFTYNTLSARRAQYLMTGLNLRMGPLSIGTNNLLPVMRGDVSNFNLYAILRIAIPYKRVRDLDKDGVIDKKDLCPEILGELNLNGCPDADHDGIADKDDACPHQPGIQAFKGCPDADGDGIKDAEDECPNEKGSLALKGCPDSDGDLVIDKNDACPETPGLKELRGCPDKDRDGIIDKEDLCPDRKGPVQYKGCPDTDNDKVHDGIDSCRTIAGPVENAGCPWPDSDKDGVIDKNDSCVNVPGTLALKGCPEPVKLGSVEKRILQKAFSSLEFESGKDVIKPISLPSLNALAKLLSNHQTDWLLKLSGHTDNEGTEESNLLLSEKRAKAVQNYLVKKGVLSANILVEWFGQSQPIADNTTKEGRKKNRRVEMTVIMKME